jgi:hypothetical protein
MTARTFPVDNLPSPGNPTVRQFAARIECSKCGATDHYSKPRATSWMAVEQRFRKLGWHVGNGPRADLCPECQKREKPNLRVVQNPPPSSITSDKLVASVETLKPVADPPREMGRDDRRVIFAKIDENWLGEKEGYAAPWTDKAIAKDLGVPAAWVAQVRDEMFGPAGNNPEIDELFNKHEEVLKEFEVIKTEYHRLTSLYSESIAHLRKRFDFASEQIRGLESEIAKIKRAIGK